MGSGGYGEGEDCSDHGELSVVLGVWSSGERGGMTVVSGWGTDEERIGVMV